MGIRIKASGVVSAIGVFLFVACTVSRCWSQEMRAAVKPNMVFILVDDLGIGDVGCYNTASKIKTPNVDRLAAQGMRFTDAHSPSSVCTPTRYGLLTGRYAWRTGLQKGVLFGLSAPLIAPGRLTVAGLLKQAGYHTACIGKWHLGLGWSGTTTDAGDLKGGAVDYARALTDSPVTHGFDQFFGISGSLDMPPFVWIENDRVAEQPTTVKKWVREGPAGKTFEAVDVLPELTARAVATIDARARAAKAGSPFFIYLPYASPHTPIVPSAAWLGRSGISPYADFVMQTDHGVGQVLDALERNGLTRDTLVIFASDNGCSPAANVNELEAKGHRPSGIYRGYKADIWEGGHRVPFICRWPARVEAGVERAQLISLTDFMATCAELTGQALPDNAGEDSVSFAATLLGSDKPPVRANAIQHSIDGRFTIREATWKLEICPGSGGWAAPRDAAARKQGLPPVQLYDLAVDPSETHNLAMAQPEQVTRLRALLERQVSAGRSTPGAPQTNDVAVVIEK